MKYSLKYSVALLTPLLLFSACRKEPNYPDTPQIEFKRVEQYTTSSNGIEQDQITLVIGYKDGDGNLGLNKSDTTSVDFDPPFDIKSPYFNNFFAALQVKRGDTYVPYTFPSDALNFNGRFQRLSEDGRPEALEGEIKYTISSFASDIIDADTVRFEVYIYDRALNKSNTVLTDDIVLFSGQPKP